MKINYSGIIAEEQCMKASSWRADEPVAHINVVKRLITQVNEAKEESAKLRELLERALEDRFCERSQSYAYARQEQIREELNQLSK